MPCLLREERFESATVLQQVLRVTSGRWPVVAFQAPRVRNGERLPYRIKVGDRYGAT